MNPHIKRCEGSDMSYELLIDEDDPLSYGSFLHVGSLQLYETVAVSHL